MIGASATARGRDFMAWGVLGGIFALIYLLCIPVVGSSQETNTGPRGAPISERKCPECAEMIKVEARKCRFCGSEVKPLAPNAAGIQPGMKHGDIARICPTCHSVNHHLSPQCFACVGDIADATATYFAC